MAKCNMFTVLQSLYLQYYSHRVYSIIVALFTVLQSLCLQYYSHCVYSITVTAFTVLQSLCLLYYSHRVYSIIVSVFTVLQSLWKLSNLTCTGREICVRLQKGVRLYTAKKHRKGQIGIKDNATINTVKKIRQLTDYIVFTVLYIYYLIALCQHNSL